MGLRIMRLVKLIKKVPALWSLWQGVGEAMGSMIWVLVLTVVVLYAFSVLMVYIVKDGSIYPHGPPEEVATVFPDVWGSVFSLFTVMNGDDLEYFDPMIDSFHPAQCIYVVFIILSTWAILSILTAVVSEKMIKTTQAEQTRRQTEEKQEHMKKLEQEVNRVFQEALGEADQAGGLGSKGKIKRETLERILRQDKAITDKILMQTNLELDEVAELLRIHEDSDGAVDQEHFINCLERQ